MSPFSQRGAAEAASRTGALVELVPAAFRTFAERFPDVGIEAVAGHSGELLSALRDDQLDLALLAMNGQDSDAVCWKLLHREPLVLAIPDNHPLADEAAVAMSDLAEQPMILLPRALEPLHQHLPSVVLADTPTASLMVHEAITLESAYSAVAAGLAVAVVVESTARTVAVHGVVHRPFAPPQPALELSLAWPQGRMSTAARAFLMVVAELAALDPVRHFLHFPPYLPQRQPALARNGSGTG